MRFSSHAPDRFLIFTIGSLLLIGLFMLASASPIISYTKFHHPYHFLFHQITFGLLPGIFLFFIGYKTDYHFWRKISFFFLLLTIFLLGAVFIPGIGASFGRARSWIKLGNFSFQPSELVKLSLIFYLSAILSKTEKKIKDIKYGLLPFLLLIGLIFFLLYSQPDLGTLSIIIATSLIIYFVSGGKLTHILGIILSGLLVVSFLLKKSSYQMMRIKVFLNPDAYPKLSYHLRQALLSIGSGGLFGLGLGESRGKFAYVPEAYSDSIFSVIAEELGFFFSLFLVFLFVFFALRGLRIAKRSPDKFGQLLAVGIVSWITVQAFVNIMSMINLVPMTGVPLPLISYGGSALAVSLFALGILLNLSKYTRE